MKLHNSDSSVDCSGSNLVLVVVVVVLVKWRQCGGLVVVVVVVVSVAVVILGFDLMVVMCFRLVREVLMVLQKLLQFTLESPIL